MTDLELYVDLAARKLTTSDGGAVTLPPLVLGDVLRCTLHTMERIDGGSLRELDLHVRTLHASIGKAMEPPTDGQFALKIENPLHEGEWHQSDPIAFDSDAAALRASLLAMLDPLGWTVDAAQKSAAGCWLIQLGEMVVQPAVFQVASNVLTPESFVRVRPFQQNGRWWHEVRLIQTPLSFNDGHERVLPPPPIVTRIYSGRAATNSMPAINELQDLHLPPDFRGTYFLRWNYRVSTVLGVEDGPDKIAAALDAMFNASSGASAPNRFNVTNPEADHAYIEFVNDLAAMPQELITVEVNSFAPGVLTFMLPLDREALCSALRSTPQLIVPLEIEMEIVDDDTGAPDATVPGRIDTFVQQAVTILREQIFSELASVQPIDWLRPPAPRDYIPFTPDQIIVGVQHYVAAFGNGEARSFSFPHNLGTEAFHLTVRQNRDGGRLLVPGDEYTVQIPSGNEVVVNFPQSAEAPAMNSLAVTLSSAGPRSAFQAHTHTMAQIIGLLDALATLSARVTAIEERLPFTDPATPAVTTGTPFEVPIADFYAVFPGRFATGYDPKSGGPPTRAGALFPAIHDATVTEFSDTLPDYVIQSGNVFKNSGAAMLLSGGFGHHSTTFNTGECIGSDGRAWFKVNREAVTNSYFPADMERELFMFFINEQMFRPGTAFQLEFKLALRTLLATTRCEYVLKIETGTAPQDTVPAPVATNLQDVIWSATPLLAQRLILSDTKLEHHFGVAIRHNLDDSLSADQLLYSVWTAAAAVPGSANFAIRARLVQFDTEDSVSGAKGAVSIAMTGASAAIK